MSVTAGTDTALGPWIWERVERAAGEKWCSINTWRICPAGIPRINLRGPWPCAVVACTRFSSMSRDLSRDGWLDEVRRGFEASQTFLRFKAVTSPAIIFPWIRVQSSSNRFTFGPHEVTPPLAPAECGPTLRLPLFGYENSSTSSGHFRRVSMSGSYQLALTDSPRNCTICTRFASGTPSSDSIWQSWNGMASPASATDLWIAGMGWTSVQPRQRSEE